MSIHTLPKAHSYGFILERGLSGIWAKRLLHLGHCASPIGNRIVPEILSYLHLPTHAPGKGKKATFNVLNECSMLPSQHMVQGAFYVCIQGKIRARSRLRASPTEALRSITSSCTKRTNERHFLHSLRKLNYLKRSLIHLDKYHRCFLRGYRRRKRFP